MSSYYFTNTDAGPPSVGVQNGKYCMDGTNWVCEHRSALIGLYNYALHLTVRMINYFDRWTAISNMVAWRNAAGTSDVAYWQVNLAQFITKGNRV